MPKIGSKTIEYSLYAKIQQKLKQLGNTTELQLPSIEYGTDTIKGSGILGEIDWPSLFSPGSMTFSISSRIIGADAIAIGAPEYQEFEVRWVTDLYDSGNRKIGIVGHKAFIGGLPKKIDMGKLETNAAMDVANEYEVLYYRLVNDGKEVILIDKLNYIFKVNGIDYAAGIKAAL